MNRKDEIGHDLWAIMREVYQINVASHRSEKQDLLITRIVEYIDMNLSTRRKKQEPKEKSCSKELPQS